MKLSEIAALIVVHGPTKSKFLGGKPPDVHLKHARAAWQGKAYVLWMDHLGFYIFGDDCSAPYRHGFDDFMADDWELIPNQRGEDTQ